MATIRWTIRDRATGQAITVPQPTTDGERTALKAGIRNLSRLAMRGGALYEG